MTIQYTKYFLFRIKIQPGIEKLQNHEESFACLIFHTLTMLQFTSKSDMGKEIGQYRIQNSSFRCKLHRIPLPLQGRRACIYVYRSSLCIHLPSTMINAYVHDMQHNLYTPHYFNPGIIRFSAVALKARGSNCMNIIATLSLVCFSLPYRYTRTGSTTHVQFGCYPLRHIVHVCPRSTSLNGSRETSV